MADPNPAGPRSRMLDATIALMRRSGLSGAGINEIVRESGAPKGSVYHFFPDGKRQIAAEALAGYSTRVLAFIDASLAGKRSPGGKVRALFEAFAQRLEEGRFRVELRRRRRLPGPGRGPGGASRRGRRVLRRLDRLHRGPFRVPRRPPRAVLRRPRAHRHRRSLHPRPGRALGRAVQGSRTLARRHRGARDARLRPETAGRAGPQPLYSAP